MPPILVASPEHLDGRTTAAVAIGHWFAANGKKVSLLRLEGDGHAADDAKLLASLPFNAGGKPEPVKPEDVPRRGTVIVEAPAGDARATAEALKAKVAVVLAYADPLPADIPSFCEAFGGACAGVIVTRVPLRRMGEARAALEAAGCPPLALLPEDRTLAAPPLGAVAEALEADATSLNSASETIIDRPIISSISTDPAQAYVSQQGPNAVIVRSDKPDQQLAALNAGVRCLIVTGGLPVLSYVLERAESDGVPILQTRLETAEAMGRLESLVGGTSFCGAAKVERVAALAADLDLSALARK
jgi:hypothetical protein